MKKICCLLIAIVLVNFANAQWIKLKSGTSKNLNDTYFINGDIGYAVGDSGVIIKTIDGGVNWKAQNSTVGGKLSSVFFTNTLNGYVVGEDATLLKTADGGLNWVKHPLGLPTTIFLNAVYFTNDSSGYITSNTIEQISNSSIILKTKNKWSSWRIDTLGIGVTSSVCFPSEDTGYLVGNCIRKTTNAGTEWQSKSLNNINLNAVTQNIYDHTIVAVGDNGKIVYGQPTTAIFNILDKGTGENLRYITYDSYYHKYFVVGNKGVILMNSDLKPMTDWTPIKSGVTCNLNSVSTIDQSDNSNVIVGDSGTVLKSTNSGDSWVKLNSGVVTNLYSIAGNHGPNEESYIVGDNGLILRLYNNMISKIQEGLTTRKLNYVCYNGTYFTKLAYYIVGEKGTIIKTTDDFKTYTFQNVDSTIDLTYIHFYNANAEPTTSGFACGFDNTRNESVILYTTDGGTHWYRHYTGITTKLKGGSDQNQYITGEGGTILYAPDEHYPTSYNFKYWKHYNVVPHEQMLGSVFFTNTNVGFAANRNSKLFKSMDGGNNWNLIPVDNVRSIFFNDSLNGYVVGSSGTIKRSRNAGITWTSETSNTTLDLNKVYCPDENVSYAVGRTGTILKTWRVIVNNAVICHGDTATLTAKGNAVKYAWSNGDTVASIHVSPAVTTTYTVTAYSANGIKDTEVVVVTVIQQPNVTVTVDHPVIKVGQSAILCASGGDSYIWSNGKTTACITVSPIVTTTYTVTGKNSCGLTDTTTVVVTVDTSTSVESPDKENIQVLLYPMPATKSIILELSTALKGDLYMYTVNGQELIRQPVNGCKTEIDISGLTSGIYFVKLIHDRGIEVRKMIKQ